MEIIGLKKDGAGGLGMKTLTGIRRSVCFAWVVPVMHVAELLEVCTTWKGNKDTHTAKNCYDRHTGGLEVFRDGQGRSWSGLGGVQKLLWLLWEQHYHKRELSACMRLSPRQETLQGTAPGPSNPGRGRRQEVPSAQTSSDHSSLAWSTWAVPG